MKEKTIFAQVMSLVNIYEFKKYVNRYKGDRHAIKFICCDQFMLMSFISSRTDSDQETYRLHLTFILSTFTVLALRPCQKPHCSKRTTSKESI
ncbi:MAG: DUF4372 domain-containing protein [Phocaeicola vulgatus]|uniref:DUF4372 domain-containing protein n=1 Tax=Bacteroidaceae TaxID=815 RepID=UPI000FEF6923|nr:DUF4372 domain-containing protein [Phocaeicola vulgatus]MDU3761430.1 DUF4372 domain-containing protein [Bacteroides sp.]KAB3735710.1 DUF4372 domain-containing protein [Phocaeicola vulgatus]MDU9009300.1 DUF4372 domain-containing protein [Phocaeicola vulgatus]MDY2676500.1 DUF4372 domain-containing protein [Phocaeicola vulgatus]RHK77087.1 DUF4372 domain-containing protein [Phocaeicola vulgatus]